MNYYKRHLGDYAKKAGHLSPLEHGVYNLILDAYYDREQAPTEADALRWARARNPDETQAVSTVLHEFFILTDGHYVQPRVEAELKAAQDRAEHNRKVGKLGGRPSRARKTPRVPSGLQSGSENNPNPLIHKSTTDTAPKARSGVALKTFLDECKANGEKAVPDNDPIFDYAEKVGLPPEYLVLAWAWFTEAMASKRQKDWRAHFRNAVRNNWPRYWYAVEGGGWKLTTAGEQAARARQ